jgi:hypothetical protein
VFYDIKWISSGAFEFEKKQSLKIDPGTEQLYIQYVAKIN